MAKIDYKKVTNDYREALRALYGDKIANKSNIYYSGGWIYINIAQKFPDGSIGAVGIADNGRRASKVIEMTQVLLNRVKAKKDKV